MTSGPVETEHLEAFGLHRSDIGSSRRIPRYVGPEAYFYAVALAFTVMVVPTSELCSRYSALYTGAIADSLDEMGYEEQVLPPEINPLTHGMSLAGVAYPVVGRRDKEVEYDENIRRILEMLGDAPEFSVLVTRSRDDVAAHIGELSTTALDERGCRGAVIDGGARDVSHILEQDFPVFARYRTPADAPPRWRLVDWDVSIQIGAVEVTPGDVIVGDVDGVVCVPEDQAEAVLERAEETVDTESQIREAIGRGVDPIEAYDEYGTF